MLGWRQSSSSVLATGSRKLSPPLQLECNNLKSLYCSNRRLHPLATLDRISKLPRQVTFRGRRQSKICSAWTFKRVLQRRLNLETIITSRRSQESQSRQEVFKYCCTKTAGLKSVNFLPLAVISNQSHKSIALRKIK